MSNILKVTNPTVAYENNTVNKQTPSQQADDLSIKNPVEANRVGRADGRTEAGGDDGGQKGISYESNFGSFVQSLRDIGSGYAKAGGDHDQDDLRRNGQSGGIRDRQGDGGRDSGVFSDA